VLAVAIFFSIFGLSIGPLLVPFASRHRGLGAAVDGLVRCAVPALVVTSSVPHLYEEIGAIGPVLVAAGFIALGWLERCGPHSGRVGAAIVLPTLVLHSVFDGAGLALVFGEHGSGAATVALGGALVIHRVPEGLFIGTALVPRVGQRGAIKWVVALAAGTLVGALGGQELLGLLPHATLHALVAIGLGAMVRLVVHRHEHARITRRSPNANPPPLRAPHRLLRMRDREHW